jgi:hypothetical protein
MKKVYVSFIVPTRKRTHQLLKSCISIEKNTPKNIKKKVRSTYNVLEETFFLRKRLNSNKRT